MMKLQRQVAIDARSNPLQLERLHATDPISVFPFFSSKDPLRLCTATVRYQFQSHTHRAACQKQKHWLSSRLENVQVSPTLLNPVLSTLTQQNENKCIAG